MTCKPSLLQATINQWTEQQETRRPAAYRPHDRAIATTMRKQDGYRPLEKSVFTSTEDALKDRP